MAVNGNKTEKLKIQLGLNINYVYNNQELRYKNTKIIT